MWSAKRSFKVRAKGALRHGEDYLADKVVPMNICIIAIGKAKIIRVVNGWNYGISFRKRSM